MKKHLFYYAVSVLCLIIILAAGVWIYSRHTGENPQPETLKHPGTTTPETPDIPRSSSRSFPGEFEEQQAVWLQWPTEIYDQGYEPVTPTMVSIIKALALHVDVNIMVQSRDEIEGINSLLAQGVTQDRIHYYAISHQSIWARDVGPIFIKDENKGLSVVDFSFNNYGRDTDQYYIDTESSIDRLAAQQLNLPVVNSSLISEGGAIESNGRGTLMVTETVALARNPGLTKQQIEDEYKRVLGVSKVIWLNKGLAEDDAITGGHINEIARFAGPGTVLLAQVLPECRYESPASNESYLRLEENCRILEESSDQDGKPLNIIRVPLPPAFESGSNNTGKTPVRSYLNYAVTNGAVLMQVYWKPGRPDALKSAEDMAKAALQRAFPGREIIEIDAESINLWGGGIHCVTQHMPAGSALVN